MPEHRNQTIHEALAAVEEATFDYTLGDNEQALSKLNRVIQAHPDCFAAWHALTEVHFSKRELDEALKAAQKAFELCPEDVHINTSLSRIWMEKGDKKMAEHFGAQARMLGWKEQIQESD